MGLAPPAALSPQALLARVEFEGEERVRLAYARGKGVLFVTGHFGFWELQAMVHALRLGPMAVLARLLDNRALNGLLETMRTRTGNTVVYKQGSMRRIMRLLEPKKPDGSPGTQEEAVNACDVKAGRPPRKLLGMAVLTGFKPGTSNASLTGGKAYNVEDCDTYSIDATAIDDGRALELRHWTGMKRTWTLVR